MRKLKNENSSIISGLCNIKQNNLNPKLCIKTESLRVLRDFIRVE